MENPTTVSLDPTVVVWNGAFTYSSKSEGHFWNIGGAILNVYFMLLHDFCELITSVEWFLYLY